MKNNNDVEKDRHYKKVKSRFVNFFIGYAIILTIASLLSVMITRVFQLEGIIAFIVGILVGTFVTLFGFLVLSIVLRK